jgi:acyl-coenzyme A synthetase/AMP-(fatty) acid ligase
VAGFKVPKAFEFASELPRTASGKLLRRQLK